MELKAKGLIVVPPSPCRSVVDDAPKAELPSGWVKLAMNREDPSRPHQQLRGPKVEVLEGGNPIPESTRNTELTRICGRLHDGTRDLEQLIEALVAINEERCNPPQPRREVEKIARSIHKKPCCKPPKPKQLRELIAVLSDVWFERKRKGLGGKNEVRFTRLLIREGARIGTATSEGLRVKMSLMEVARRLGCHVNTVLNIVGRLKEKGELRQDLSERRSRRDPGTFVLLDPRLTCDSHNNFSLTTETTAEGCSTITSKSRKGVADLKNAHHRHRGPVGYGGEDVLCYVEAYGPRTAAAGALALGWTRARDFRARRLDPLVEEGLLERRGDLYALPGDYQERVEKVRRKPYSTVQQRRVRSRTPEGPLLTEVKETGSVASEEMREIMDTEAYARRRELFLDRLKKERLAESPEGLADVVDLLNRWDEEREAFACGPEPRELIGWVDELDPASEHHSPTPLVEALRSYLDDNPRDVGQPVNWLAITLWAHELVPKKPTRGEVADALVEVIGGTRN